MYCVCLMRVKCFTHVVYPWVIAQSPVVADASGGASAPLAATDATSSAASPSASASATTSASAPAPASATVSSAASSAVALPTFGAKGGQAGDVALRAPLPASQLDWTYADLIAAGKEHLICITCRTVKGPRVKHCRHCDRCVFRMDHHCPWINNCVGAGACAT